MCERILRVLGLEREGFVTSVFLMTDVEGSTSLWERFGDEMPSALAQHDEIVHGSVAAHEGEVFKHTGDGMIAVFEGVDAAVAAARRAIEGLAAAEWGPPAT